MRRKVTYRVCFWRKGAILSTFTRGLTPYKDRELADKHAADKMRWFPMLACVVIPVTE
jgi:hypothetical protein